MLNLFIWHLIHARKLSGPSSRSLSMHFHVPFKSSPSYFTVLLKVVLPFTNTSTAGEVSILNPDDKPKINHLTSAQINNIADERRANCFQTTGKGWLRQQLATA